MFLLYIWTKEAEVFCYAWRVGFEKNTREFGIRLIVYRAKYGCWGNEQSNKSKYKGEINFVFVFSSLVCYIALCKRRCTPRPQHDKIWKGPSSTSSFFTANRARFYNTIETKPYSLASLVGAQPVRMTTMRLSRNVFVVDVNFLFFFQFVRSFLLLFSFL